MVGDYALFSAIQQESGPRLFYPYFGLAYMGKNAQVRIVILKNYVYQVSFGDLGTQWQKETT